VPDASPQAYRVAHDPQVQSIMQRLGGFRHERSITARLALHFPDRDFYSLPAWNRDLCARIVQSAGSCTAYEYPGNTHVLRLSTNPWFSPAGSREAYGQIIAHDIGMFR
jgi:hypothetical protein